MARRERVIGDAAALADGGEGIRFTVRAASGPIAAFAIRYRGAVHAYVNTCAHEQAELDWLPGAFFDADGEKLVCSLHGARYEPRTGRCAGGPCRGRALARVPIRVRADGAIVVRDPPEEQS
jgi:nitrite reductase/ring-hydroxylating ferredoxin subunit